MASRYRRTYRQSRPKGLHDLRTPAFPIHHQARSSAEAHQFANVTDFFLSDPRMDLLYYERATGGHLGVLNAYNTPEVYDWMFSHTTAVPEPQRRSSWSRLRCCWPHVRPILVAGIRYPK